MSKRMAYCCIWLLQMITFHSLHSSVFRCNVRKGIMISMREHLSASGGPPLLLRVPGVNEVGWRWRSVCTMTSDYRMACARDTPRCPRIPTGFGHAEGLVCILVVSESETNATGFSSSTLQRVGVFNLEYYYVECALSLVRTAGSFTVTAKSDYYWSIGCRKYLKGEVLSRFLNVLENMENLKNALLVFRSGKMHVKWEKMSNYLLFLLWISVSIGPISTMTVFVYLLH